MKAMLLAMPILCLVFAAAVQAGDDGSIPSPRLPEPETGVASWYGYPYHGRVAAGGEVYDMEKLTAAHPTLPFGTWVRVMNLRNEKSVEVRITDRGPFVDGRVIDLSKAAARTVDMLDSGIADVKIQIISGPSEGPDIPRPDFPQPEIPQPVTTDVFAVQVGAFQSRANAERVLATMKAQYGSGRIVIREGVPTMFRVMVGAEKTQESAVSLALRIRQDSTQQTAFVARLDR
jgi:rare lipoprotein A